MKTFEEYVELVNDPMMSDMDRMLINVDLYIENVAASLDIALDVISEISDIYQEGIEDKYDYGDDGILFEAGLDEEDMSTPDNEQLNTPNDNSVSNGEPDDRAARRKARKERRLEKKAARHGYVSARKDDRTDADIDKAKSYAFDRDTKGKSKDYYSTIPIQELPDKASGQPPQKDKGVLTAIATAIANIIDKVLMLFKSKEAKQDIKDTQARAKRLSDMVKEAGIGSVTLVVPDDTTIASKYDEVVKKSVKLINFYKKFGYKSKSIVYPVGGGQWVEEILEWSYTLNNEIDELTELMEVMRKRYTKSNWSLETDYGYQVGATKRSMKIASAILEKNVNISVNSALQDLTSEKTAGIINNVTKNLELIREDLVNNEVIRAFGDVDFYAPYYVGRNLNTRNMTSARHFSTMCARLSTSYYRFIHDRNNYYLLLITSRLKEAGVKPGDITVIESVKRDIKLYDTAANNFSDYVRGAANSYYDFIDSREALYTEAGGIIGRASDVIQRIIRAAISFVSDMRYRMSAYIAGVRFRSYMNRLSKILTEKPELTNTKVMVKDYSKAFPAIEKAQKMLDIRIEAFRRLNKNNAVVLDSPDVANNVMLQKLERELKEIQRGSEETTHTWPINGAAAVAGSLALVTTIGAAYAMLQEHSRRLDKEMLEVLNYTKSLDNKLDVSVGLPRRSAECAIGLAEEGAMIANAKSRSIVGRLQSLVASIMSAITPGEVMDNTEVAAITGAKFESTLSDMEKELFADVYKEAFDEAVGYFHEEHDIEYDGTNIMDGEMESDDERVPGDTEANSYLNGMVGSLSEEYTEDDDDSDYDPMKDIF